MQWRMHGCRNITNSEKWNTALAIWKLIDLPDETDRDRCWAETISRALVKSPLEALDMAFLRSAKHEGLRMEAQCQLLP